MYKFYQYFLKSIKYFGYRYQCPICLSHIKKFLPLPPQHQTPVTIYKKVYQTSDFETINVDNYYCPICSASDRERLYALYLSQALVKTSSKRFIHFSPEATLRKWIVRHYPRLSYKTADLNMKDADDIVDLMNLRKYSDNTVDYFICSHVLEHIVDDRKAISELYRILKPGGWGILMAPVLSSLERSYENKKIRTEKGRLSHFGQEDHVRVYAKKDYLGKIKECGFFIRQLGIDYFSVKTYDKCGIVRISVLYVVYKK